MNIKKINYYEITWAIKIGKKKTEDKSTPLSFLLYTDSQRGKLKEPTDDEMLSLPTIAMKIQVTVWYHLICMKLAIIKSVCLENWEENVRC